MGCDNYRMRCYCQGDGCSRAQLDGLFGVMVGRKEENGEHLVTEYSAMYSN